MSTIRVLVADDHPLIAQALSRDLTDFGISEVISVSNGNEVVDRFLDLKFEVLVLDLYIGPVKGLEVARTLISREPGARIVVYSQFDADHIVREAYRLGVMSFVPKNTQTQVLAEAIKAANAGDRYFPPDVARKLAKLAIEGDENPEVLLNEREFQVFKLLADGLTHSETAAKLGINIKTVGFDLAAIKVKLNVDRMADFTKLAIKYQLLD